MEVYSQELYLALIKRSADIQLHRPTAPLIGKPSLLQIIKFSWRATEAIWRHRKSVDILLVGDVLLTPLSLVAKLICGTHLKVVAAAHGNDVYFAQNLSVKGLVYRLGISSFRRHVDLLIANSLDIESAAGRLGFSPTTKIPLGTTVPAGTGPNRIAEPAVLFAGRLNKCKGLAWFVNEVLPKLPTHIRLIVAGPEWDESELDAVLSSHRTEYLGAVTRQELDDLRKRVIATVMPNLPASLSGQNEGFGLAALESAAIGVPVVASRLGGLAEAVVEGITGFLVEPTNADAFAKKIREIARWTPDERMNFAARAIQEIEQRFTWDRVAREYLSRFEALSANSGGESIGRSC
ncbi:MAG TPA: glycosyltransferase family 4 protein [Frateuria sp.]|uniref:glycosyltransferase family 4 protein n=1 Tax=Frateuria sp. TaxID=2211372 RepID=UPI002D7EA06E|nr:glycosyltransferase family 4 protein [Frateuria sp.]HET6807306.1 glycosyltransferase family 4 protein [Frateuria sp.]